LADCVGGFVPAFWRMKAVLPRRAIGAACWSILSKTKPAVWHGGGGSRNHHQRQPRGDCKMAQGMSLKTKFEKRPELLERATHNEKDKWYLRTIAGQNTKSRNPSVFAADLTS
jgi:hypothetical protein